MTAIGVDRSVWLYARSEDVPGELIGALQRAWVHVPVRRPVEQFRQVLPVHERSGLRVFSKRVPAVTETC